MGIEESGGDIDGCYAIMAAVNLIGPELGISSARMVAAGFGKAISIMLAGIVDMSVWVCPRGISSRCFGVRPRYRFSDPSFFMPSTMTGDGLISLPSCIFFGL